MKHNTDKEKATVRQKAPKENPNMKTDTQTKLDKQSNRILSSFEQVQYEKCIRAQAQAAKLAEALRRFTEAYRLQSEHDLECAEAEASKALAEYEASRQ
jgi:hypothetical protein